jgi:multidrug efflux pump subunit AcrA (membrane-fusion protein)
VGPALGELVEINTGLKEGERVVLNPPASLSEGDRVKLKES